MPTYAWLARFWSDFKRLSPDEQTAFLAAVTDFVTDLSKKDPFRKSLRVKGIQGKLGVFEMTWSGGGRATFEYGTPLRDNDVHIIWRRVGTHNIFNQP